MKFAEILVTGKVKGVWYRDLVKKNAIALFLSGWVKNNPDGTVSAAVQGEEEIINQLIDKLKIGPPLSKVEDLLEGSLSDENRNTQQEKRGCKVLVIVPYCNVTAKSADIYLPVNP